MTVQGLIDSLSVRFADPDKTMWSDQELLVYVNQGTRCVHQLLVARNDPLVLSVGELSTVEGVSSYELPAGFLAMYTGSGVDRTGVWIGSSYLQPCKPDRSADHSLSSGGEPKEYYLTPTSIVLLPTPDDTYTVSYAYFTALDALALTDNMPFQDLFNDAIGEYVCAKARLRGEMDATAAMQVYNELERRALNMVAVRTPVRPRMRLRRR